MEDGFVVWFEETRWEVLDFECMSRSGLVVVGRGLSC